MASPHRYSTDDCIAICEYCPVGGVLAVQRCRSVLIHHGNWLHSSTPPRNSKSYIRRKIDPLFLLEFKRWGIRVPWTMFSGKCSSIYSSRRGCTVSWKLLAVGLVRDSCCDRLTAIRDGKRDIQGGMLNVSDLCSEYHQIMNTGLSRSSLVFPSVILVFPSVILVSPSVTFCHVVNRLVRFVSRRSKKSQMDYS